VGPHVRGLGREAGRFLTTHVADPERVPDAPLVPPGGAGGLFDVFRRRYLLRLLVKKELAARYQGSFLGLLWSYVQPGVRFAMYFFVIGLVLGLHKDVENFGIHIFSAMVFVHYFTETFSSGTRSIVRNKALVRKMALPREMFPMAAMLVSAYHTIPQGLILLAGCLATGWTPDTEGMLAGLLGFSIFAVFGMGLALLFSAANVFFRDFQNIVQTALTFTHWAVPMIYPFSKLSQSSLGGTWVEAVYLANPIAEATLLMQRCFWVYTTSDPAATIALDMPDHLFTRGLIELAVCLVFLVIAQMSFTRLERKFAERL
jgi:ABC-2 type transport system permease protein